jgi:hypothetical protein
VPGHRIPVKCSLKNFPRKGNYIFIVRGKDCYGRVGSFSEFAVAKTHSGESLAANADPSKKAVSPIVSLTSRLKGLQSPGAAVKKIKKRAAEDVGTLKAKISKIEEEKKALEGDLVKAKEQILSLKNKNEGK